MKKIILAILTLFLVTSCGFKSVAATNELPLYGGIPRSPQEQKIDQEFVNTVIKQYGSREAAYQAGEEVAWNYFFKGDHKTAMKRFNQLWLVDPENPRVYNGYGAIAEKQGDLKSAMHWYQIGAKKGDPKAQYNLAGFYFSGRGGIPKNIDEAIKWIHKAADQDLNWALTGMGAFNEHGIGMPQSYEEAKKWYEKADKHPGGGAFEDERGKIFKDLKRRAP